MIIMKMIIFFLLKLLEICVLFGFSVLLFWLGNLFTQEPNLFTWENLGLGFSLMLLIAGILIVILIVIYILVLATKYWIKYNKKWVSKISKKLRKL